MSSRSSQLASMKAATSSSTSRNNTKKKKKIVIKQFRKPPQLPADFYETSVDALVDTCWNVLLRLQQSSTTTPQQPSPSSSSSSMSLQQAYSRVVDLCAHHYGEQLYGDVHDKILQRAVEYVLQDCSQQSDLLLYLTSSPYPLYQDFLKMVRHILLPLDRAFVWNVQDKKAVARSNTSAATATSSNTSATTTLSLWQMALLLFQKHLDKLNLSSLLQDAWWNALWEDCRTAGSNTSIEIKSSLIKTMHMWHDWNVHHYVLSSVIEPRWKHALQVLSQSYKDSSNYSPSQFLTDTYHTMWQHVITQYSVFLPRVFLQRLFEQYLWEPHMNTEYLLRQEGMSLSNLDFWQTIYKLGVRMRKSDLVCTSLVTHCMARVRATLNNSHANNSRLDSTTITSTVDQLLELQRQILTLKRLLSAIDTNTTTTNNSNSSLDRLLKQMWSSTLNDDPARMAEVLAKYIDMCLRNPKKTPDSTMLSELLQLFVHLQAKDVFEAFYKKDLAKRLVMEKVQTMEMERQFVSLLKSECGTGYTSKMEGMFQDIAWSKENMALYKDTSARSSQGNSVTLDIKVLTTGYWPMYPQYPDLHLPESLMKPQDVFLDYYKAKYQGRRMQWQYALGSVDVRAEFDRSYMLNMSLLPALVLLCFNNDDKPTWTLPEVQQATGIQDADEVSRILHNLSLGKVRLLLKHDHDAGSSPRKTRSTVHPTDTFTVRADFTSKQLRIRISNIQLKETREDRQKTLETVSRDRLYLIDAVLVRIMKARKTILHQELIPQVMEQIKVPAQPADIKLRIESLIEREYMERDGEDRNRYNYLA